MRFLKKLENQTSIWFLIGICFFFFLLRLPSLFEPLWYGDEGVYEVIGTALRHGRQLYSGIWDNKPPLLYYIYAQFNGDQSSVRLLSLLFGIASIIVFFFLSKKLFHNERMTYVTTIVFGLLFAIPLLEGNIANAENFMILPIGLSALLIMQWKSTSNFSPPYLNLFIAGLLLGIAFLIKVVAIIDFAAFFFFIFIVNYRNLKSIRNQISPFLYFFAGFIAPFLLTCLFFLIQGNFGDFIKSAFTDNVGYVAYKNAYIIPQGLLVIKLIVLAVLLFFLFFNRTGLSQSQLFILIWLAFSVFNAFFSQRPYTHYLLVLLISFCLYVGMVLSDKKLRIAYSISGIVLIIFLINNFSLGNIKKVFPYYGNFLLFVFQRESTDEYRSFFDKATVRDYAIADFINGHAPPGCVRLSPRGCNSIFVWGDNPQLYKLTNTLPPGRYTVAYHMTQSSKALRETYDALQKNVPRYIITLPVSRQIPFSLIWYRERFSFDSGTIYERIY